MLIRDVWNQLSDPAKYDYRMAEQPGQRPGSTWIRLYMDTALTRCGTGSLTRCGTGSLTRS